MTTESIAAGLANLADNFADQTARTATLDDGSTVTYAVRRLQDGPARWAITRDGVSLTVERNQRSAEREVEIAAQFANLTGHESSLVQWWVKRADAQREARP